MAWILCIIVLLPARQACQLRRAPAVSSPPQSIGYFPHSRRCPPATIRLDIVQDLCTSCHCFSRAGPWEISYIEWHPLKTHRGPVPTSLPRSSEYCKHWKPSSPPFTGDPTSCIHFIRSFEDNIECRWSQYDTSRMAHLAEQCTWVRLHVLLSAACLCQLEQQYPCRLGNCWGTRFGDEVVIVDMWVTQLARRDKDLRLSRNMQTTFVHVTVPLRAWMPWPT